MPIVVNQSREAQQITFDGVSPRSFIDRRCKELRWTRTTVQQIGRVCASLGAEATRDLFPGIVRGGAAKRRE